MNATGTITMTMREVDRLKVIEAVAERRLKPGQAADRLSLSVRQVERLVLRYRAAGVAGLVSGKRGRPSNHQLPEDLAHRALSLIRERYADFGPTLACEKLWECHGLQLSKETVRKLMTDAGLWIPRRQRPPKVYQPRARRACLGELIQIDGSDHRWFEERPVRCWLALTALQIRRLVGQLYAHGQAELTWGHRAKPGNRYLNQGTVDRSRFRFRKPG